MDIWIITTFIVILAATCFAGPNAETEHELCIRSKTIWNTYQDYRQNEVDNEKIQAYLAERQQKRHVTYTLVLQEAEAYEIFSEGCMKILQSDNEDEQAEVKCSSIYDVFKHKTMGLGTQTELTDLEKRNIGETLTRSDCTIIQKLYDLYKNGLKNENFDMEEMRLSVEDMEILEDEEVKYDKLSENLAIFHIKLMHLFENECLEEEYAKNVRPLVKAINKFKEDLLNNITTLSTKKINFKNKYKKICSKYNSNEKGKEIQAGEKCLKTGKEKQVKGHSKLGNKEVLKRDSDHDSDSDSPRLRRKLN